MGAVIKFKYITKIFEYTHKYAFQLANILARPPVDNMSWNIYHMCIGCKWFPEDLKSDNGDVFILLRSVYGSATGTYMSI